MNNTNNKKKLIIAAVIFGLIVIVMVIIALTQNKPGDDGTTATNPETTTYTDPYSGEEIVDTEGKVDESYGNEETIVYFGFSKLIDYGFTQDQLEILKIYLMQYSLKREEHGEDKIKEVTIDFETFRQSIDENTSEKSVTFDIIVNRDENQRLYVVNRSPSISTMWTDIYASNGGENLFNAETESFGDNH